MVLIVKKKGAVQIKAGLLGFSGKGVRKKERESCHAREGRETLGLRDGEDRKHLGS